MYFSDNAKFLLEKNRFVFSCMFISLLILFVFTKNHKHICDLISDDNPVNMGYLYNENDINNILQLRAKEAALDLKINILMPALGDKPQQIKQRLQEEKDLYRENILQNKNGAYSRSVLIPLNLTDDHHWVGVVVKLDKFNKTEKIYYVDPLGSHIPSNVKDPLLSIYGKDSKIEDIKVFIQTDQTGCGPLLVENLIKVAQGGIGEKVVGENEMLAIRKHHLKLSNLRSSNMSKLFLADNLSSKSDTSSIMYGGGRKKKGKGKGAASANKPNKPSGAYAEFFTAKQLRSIFEAYPELLEFSKKLYALLEEANPDRRTNDREVADRRLDAFARLLVGDETCAAVAFDGEHLIVATNRDAHDCSEMRYSIDARMFPFLIDDNNIGLYMVSKMHIEGSDKESICSKEKAVFYMTYKKIILASRGMPREIIVLLRPNVDKINFEIDPEVHKIFGVPKGKNSTVLKSRVVQLYSDLLSIPRTGEVFPTPFKNIGMQVDPLRRRVRTIVEHLAFVAKFRKNVLNRRSIENAVGELEKHRLRVFEQSLAWEIAERSKCADDLRDYSDSKKRNFKQQIDRFIELLYKDYRDFKKIHRISETNSNVIKLWSDLIVQKVNSKEIVMPDIGITVEVFAKHIYRYFIDIEKLEDYISEDIKRKGKLSELLSKESPFESSELEVILDDDGDDLHAEIRVLLHLLEKGGEIPYIATSKLCCCHCNLTMRQFGISNISGRHGKMFAKWRLPKKFIDDKGHLRTLLGEELYATYCKLKEGEHVSFTDLKRGDSGPTRAEVALRIFQSLAALPEKDIKELGIGSKKLWNDDEDLADESDYGDDDALSDFKFEEQLIASDGNCWINAVLAGINRNDGVPDLTARRLELRGQIAEQLLDNRDSYHDGIVRVIRDIIERIADNGDRAGITENFFEALSPIIEEYLDYRAFVDAINQWIRNGEQLGVLNVELDVFRETLDNLNRDWERRLGDFVRGTGYAGYAENIRADNTWGGDLELGILAQILERRIDIYIAALEGVGARFDGRHNFVTRDYTPPLNPDAQDTIAILHTGGDHYNYLRRVPPEPQIDSIEMGMLPINHAESLTTILDEKVLINPEYLATPDFMSL